MAEALRGEAGVERLVARPVGIHASVLIEVVVRSYQAKGACIGVEAAAEFIVVEIDGAGTRRESTCSVATHCARRSGQNVLKKIRRDWIERTGRQLRVWQHALGCGCAGGSVIALSRGDRVAELRRQLRSPSGSGDSSSDARGNPGKIS